MAEGVKQMRKRRPSTLNHMSSAIMIRCLIEGPSSVPEIVHETGLCYCTVRKYVKALRDAKAVHVAAWDSDTNGRRTLAAYSIGTGKDVSKPPLRSRAERARELRASKRTQTKQLAVSLGVMQ